MNYPKKVRVLKRFEYLRFFNQSEVKRLDSCVIFRLKNDLGHARLGLTVKSRAGSVARNKIKRLIRERFRGSLRSLGSYDYNVVVTLPAQTSSAQTNKIYQRVRSGLEKTWGGDEVIF